MKVFEKNGYAITKYMITNRIHICVVVGYEVVYGNIPIWEKEEININLGRIDKVTEKKINDTILIAKQYIELCTRKEEVLK